MLVTEHCRAIVLLSAFYWKWASGSGIGPCPKLEITGPPLNLTRLTGHWFEIERSFYLMELISACVTLDITETSKNRLDVVISSRSSWSGTFSISQGSAMPTRKDPSTYLYRVSTRLPRLINRYLPGAGFYQVLKTDYDNYAVIYTCSNYQLVHLDMIWIWGRKKEIEAGLRSDLYALLAAKNIDSERLVLSKTDNCTDDFVDDFDYYL